MIGVSIDPTMKLRSITSRARSISSGPAPFIGPSPAGMEEAMPWKNRKCNSMERRVLQESDGVGIDSEW